MKGLRLMAGIMPVSFLCLTLTAFFTTSSVIAQNDVTNLTHDNSRIRELSFASSSKMLVARSGDEVQVNAKGIVTSPSIHVWDMEQKRKTMAIADREYGRAACVANDGSMIAFRERNSINVMSMTTKKIVSTVKFDDNKFTRPVCFCNDRRGLVIEQGTKCLVYDIQNGDARFVREYAAPGLNHFVTSDDAYAIETFGDSIRLLDFKTGKLLHDFPLIDKGKAEELRGLVVSPDNRFVATCSDNKVRLWDMVTFKMAHTFNILQKDNIFCFSSDGRYLIGGGDTLKLWELRSRKEILGPIVVEGKISAVSASVDGKYLACGDTKGNMRVWEFSDENMSGLYFAREIANETKQMKPCGEFETPLDCDKRKKKLLRSVYGKYLSQYVDKTTNEKTIQEQWAEEDEVRTTSSVEKIKESRRVIDFTVDSISTYNAEKQTFMIKLVNTKERYSKWEAVNVPLRDGAQCFKQRAQSLEIKGIIQLKEDLVGYEVYNIKIKSNCSGKEKEYVFGAQRKYLDE